jgi:hypothetical protein
MEETLVNVDNVPKSLSNVQQVRVDFPASDSSHSDNASTQPLNQTTMSRSSTPGPSADAPSAENTAAEDLLLPQFTAAIIDIRIMENNVLRLWDQVIGMMMPNTNEDNRQTEGLCFMHRL